LVGEDDGVAGLEEVRLGRGKFHTIGHKLEGKIIAHGKAVFVYEVRMDFPESGTPDFALVMDFVGFAGVEWVERAARDAGVGADLTGVDVFEGEWIFRHIRAVREVADAEVIVLEEASELVGDVAAHGVSCMRVITGLAEEAFGVEVRPTFTHAVALEVTEGEATADEAPTGAVSQFMENNFGIERPIAGGMGESEDEHETLAVKAVRGGLEHGIVGDADASSGLDVANDIIVAEATAAEVINLVITSGLGEAEFIEAVMVPVAVIEELDGGSIDIVGGVLGEVVSEIEDAIGVADRPRAVGLLVEIAVYEGVDVIAGGGITAVIDPAIGGGGGIQSGSSDERAGNQRRLERSWGLESRREGRGAVTSIDVIGGVTDIVADFLTKEDGAVLGIQDEAKSFLRSSLVGDDLPSQAQSGAIERQPNEARVGRQRSFKDQIIAIAERAAVGEDIGSRQSIPDILGCEDQSLSDGNRRGGLEGGTAWSSGIGGSRGTRDESAGEAGEFAVFGDVTEEDGLKDGDAVEFLFPGNSMQVVVGIGVISFDAGIVEEFWSMAEERLMAEEEGLDGPIGVGLRDGLRS
jgi:hypothetical protein